MNGLEELLNGLIKKGWNPRGEPNGVEYIKGIVARSTKGGDNIGIYWTDSGMSGEFSLNDICSLDSGLRQFVCSKNLYPKDSIFLSKDKYVEDGLFVEYGFQSNPSFGEKFRANDLRYRLMLSSIQEDKATFICDNINIEGTKKD